MTTTAAATSTLECERPYLFTELFDPDVMDDILGHPQSFGFGQQDVRRLNSYKKMKVQGTPNKVDVNYERKGGALAKEKGIGRLYPRNGIGLQGFPSGIRNPLLERYYHDCDIVNAHYVLASQVADAWGLKNDNISHYVRNRDEELAKVSQNRALAKVNFLAVMFGGNPKLMDESVEWNCEIRPEGDVSLLEAIKTEVSALMDTCWSKHKEWRSIVKGKDNPKASLLALFFQTEESKCLMSIAKYVKSIGREVGVLIHDGCCIRKVGDESVLPEKMLRGAEAMVKADTGYEVSLLVKAWTHSYIPTTTEHPLVPADTLIDEAFAARRFCELMGDHFIYDNKEMWVFSTSTGMWTRDIDTLERIITQLNGKLVFKQMGPLGLKTYDFSGCCDKTGTLIRKLKCVAPVRDGYMRTRIHSDIGKILWADGIYDFKTDTFTEGFDPNIVFTARINRNFPTKRDEEKIAYIQYNTFDAPFLGTGDGELLRHETMRMMLGDFLRKKGFIGQGPWNSSKGVYTCLLQTAFGSYIVQFNGNSLLFKSFGGESERDMTFAMNFCNARIAVSSEIRMPVNSTTGKENKAVIDGNLWKTLCSGGDEWRARNLNERAQTYVNKAAVFCLLNDTPDFSPADKDTQEKVKVIAFSASFTEDPTEANERKCVSDIKDKYRESEYGDALFHILVDEYKKWKENGFRDMAMTDTGVASLSAIIPVKKIGDVLRERYVLTNNQLDSVLFTDIENYLRSCGVQGSGNKIARDLSILGLGTGKKRVKGQGVLTVRTGVREKTEEEEGGS
jgi:hypothetical protein